MPKLAFLMSFGRLLFALFAICAPNIAASQTKADVAESCLAAIEAGDTSTATALSLQISEWKNLFIASTVDAAEHCLNNATSEFWKYSTLEGAFVSGDKARETQKSEALALERTNEIERVQCEIVLLRDEIETLSASAQDVLEAQSFELLGATIGACRRSYNEDPDATLLNPVCNDAFKKTGIPDTKFSNNFSAIVEAREELAEAQFLFLLLQSSDVLLEKPAQISETQKCIDLLANK